MPLAVRGSPTLSDNQGLRVKTKTTKTKRTAYGDLEPRKKKKKPGTDLVVTSDKKLKSKDKKELKSYFGKDAKKIVEMIESGDQDGGLTLLKKRLLLTTVRAIPRAERVLMESNTTRGTYQFTTLISQIRELIADIQADQDRRYIAQAICESVIRPAFMDIAQDIITEHHSLRKTVTDMLKPQNQAQFSDELKKLAMELARGMTKKYKEVETKIFEQMKN